MCDSEEPFSKWGGTSARQKLWKNFFIKRFTLTKDPIQIVLLKLII